MGNVEHTPVIASDSGRSCMDHSVPHNIIPTSLYNIPVPFLVIPATFLVIPAQAGIHVEIGVMVRMNHPCGKMDSRLRGNDVKGGGSDERRGANDVGRGSNINFFSKD